MIYFHSCTGQNTHNADLVSEIMDSYSNGDWFDDLTSEISDLTINSGCITCDRTIFQVYCKLFYLLYRLKVNVDKQNL